MGLLEGKTALVVGVANDHSIAWGIAQAFREQGATLGFSYATGKLRKKVYPLAKSLGSSFVKRCDVSKDREIATLMEDVKAEFGGIDILVHSIAFADREELKGPFYCISRKGFLKAMDISVYSLIALVREALPIFRPGGSVITMTHHGSQQVFPNYHMMGVAKAALEAEVRYLEGATLEAGARYLAAELGRKNIRVNAISAGPVNTLSARGIPGFVEMLSAAREIAPLRRSVTLQDIGNAAVYLCSSLSAGVTGQVFQVDGGLSTVAFAGQRQITQSS